MSSGVTERWFVYLPRLARKLAEPGAPGSGTFSVERLMDFLTALGQDVEITVRPAREAQGAVSLVE